MLELPKIPKITDLVDAVGVLDGRVSALELIAASNKARLDALGDGVSDRQREIDRLRSEVERERWHSRFRRGR